MKKGTVLSDYSIRKTISQTRESHVSLADYHGRQVVIKRVDSSVGGNRENMLFRLRREGEILQASFSDTVVELLDILEDGDSIYLVMEYYDGQNLQTAMPKMSLAQKLQALAVTAAALAQIHDNDIVHRDIKPSNIVIKLQPQLEIKMIDFGLAYIKNLADVFQQGTVVGTLAYLSRQPEVPSTVNTTLPRVLDDVLLKLMQKEPAERYQTADALLHDVQRIIENPQVHFMVGQKDRTGGLNLDGRVIGRDREMVRFTRSMRQQHKGYDLASTGQSRKRIADPRGGWA